MQQPNQHAASTYRANYTSRNRLLIEWAYRSSWIIGAAVDSKADDMTRACALPARLTRNGAAFWNRSLKSFNFGIASTRR
jgi:hypothetical protein